LGAEQPERQKRGEETGRMEHGEREGLREKRRRRKNKEGEGGSGRRQRLAHWRKNRGEGGGRGNHPCCDGLSEKELIDCHASIWIFIQQS
jgi:hypothetical protein